MLPQSVADYVGLGFVLVGGPVAKLPVQLLIQASTGELRL